MFWFSRGFAEVGGSGALPASERSYDLSGAGRLLEAGLILIPELAVLSSCS